jgi:formylglycine-generating enzyme required for sulfatase activity
MRPGVERSFVRSGLLACAWFCAQFLPGAALAQGESLEARQNLLKERVVAALKSGDTLALYAAMDDFRLLEKEGAEVPPGLFFSEAAAARSMNDPVRTMRAFDDYFRVSPSEGEVFSEALRVYAELKRDVPETAWNLLEGMLPVPGGVARTDQASQGLVLQPKAGGELVIKPFSLGIREVTRAQFMEFVNATGYRPKRNCRAMRAACWPVTSRRTLWPSTGTMCGPKRTATRRSTASSRIGWNCRRCRNETQPLATEP